MNCTTHRARRLMILAVLLVLAVSTCNAASNPKNIIFIVGDGMGIGAITGARCAGPGENGQLVLDAMPITGLAKTHSEGKVVTDSAASGTALATGRKTLNGSISMDSKGNSMPSILEMACAMGKSTGVVTTDAVTGATPAVFYSHVDSRAKQDEIAMQLVGSKMTVAMGSGKQFFVPKTEGQGGRADGRDAVALAATNGFEAVFDAKAMAASKSRKILGLFNFDEAGPSFKDMLDKAIAMLSANPKGFFVMGESCLPDKGGHGNNAAISLKGVLDLDEGLRSAMEFAKKDRNTLIVVTSDHETGGLAVLERDDKDTGYKPGWVGGGHTGNMVAIYAFGPGAEKFSGTHDNTEIPKIFASLWGKKLAQ